MIDTFIVAVALLAAVFLSYRFKISAFVIELLLGIIIGKSVLNLVAPTEWISFLSDLGLLFLLFLAGLEANLTKYRGILSQGALIGSLSFILPSAALFGFLHWFGGFGVRQMLLICCAIATTSMAVVYPFLRERGITDGSTGRTLIISTIIINVLAMVGLTVATTQLSWLTLLLLPVLVVMFLFSPRLIKYLDEKVGKKNLFHWEVRFVFAFLLTITFFFEQVGLHAAVGAFFVGLVMSEFSDSEKIKHKLDVVGFSFLIPFFFLNVGLNFDAASLLEINYLLLGALFGVGWLVKSLVLFIVLLWFIPKKKDNLAYSLLFNAQLSLGIVVAHVGLSLELFDSATYTLLIVLVIFSSILALLLANKFVDAKRKKGSVSLDQEIYV